MALGVMAVAAWQAPERVDTAAVAKIRDEGLNRSQVGAHFTTLVDTIGPRLAGSPEYKRAADWARESLAKWGLSGARLEAFEFGRGWQLEKFTLEMVEPRYMPLLGYPEAWSPSTKGEVTATVAFVNGKTAQEVAALKLTNAAVMQAAPVTNFIVTDRVQPAKAPDAPPAAAGAATGAAGRGGQGGRQGGAGGRGAAAADPAVPAAMTVDQAIRAGGAAVLLRPSRGMHGTVFVQAGRDTPTDLLPKVVLAGEHYNMLVRLAQQGVPVKIRVNVQARFLDQDRNSYNVLAELPGTDAALKSEIVMLGAHLDSWHTGVGATDNADGAAVVMEAMRILKATGLQPRRTIRVALWAAEEEGLLGSRAWVRQHLPDTGPRDKVSLYLNIDPGKGPIYGWYMENNDEARPIFDAWMAPFADLGGLKNVRQGIGNTDHLSFIAAGVPGFNPIQDYTDYDVREHHTNADTPERIKVDDLKQNAIVLASFIYHAAMRTEPIPSPVRK
jgi:carboxypeptidase Q